MNYAFQQIKNIFHLLQAVLAVLYYGNPSRQITVIGVTGTDGKTTTSSLIYHILKTAGKKVSVITTVSAVIGDKVYDTGFHTTTPSGFTIQRFLREAVTHGDEYFILETTSHALDQYRVFGVNFQYGLITNVTHEHLQYHVTYENYVKAKARLIQWSQNALINRDDGSYELLQKYSPRQGKLKTYGLKHASSYQLDLSDKLKRELPTFNKYNYLAAYAICTEIGLKESEIVSGMDSFELPEGRMDIVYDKDFTVIIDFAHTPNALHEVLSAVRKQFVTQGRLIHVFGAAAFRDDSKRPMMGKESARYADLTIITEEDYRTEDPDEIARQIAGGLDAEGFTRVEHADFGVTLHSYTSIVNRRDAISKALSIATTGDLIIVTGKGHEKSLCRGKKEFPWSDEGAVRELLGMSTEAN